MTSPGCALLRRRLAVSSRSGTLFHERGRTTPVRSLRLRHVLRVTQVRLGRLESDCRAGLLPTRLGLRT